jgi:hypothetical protein
MSESRHPKVDDGTGSNAAAEARFPNLSPDPGIQKA